MKAGINKKGQIVLKAETPEEAFAIKYITATEYCKNCGSAKIPWLIDCSVLNEEEEESHRVA